MSSSAENPPPLSRRIDSALFTRANASGTRPANASVTAPTANACNSSVGARPAPTARLTYPVVRSWSDSIDVSIANWPNTTTSSAGDDIGRVSVNAASARASSSRSANTSSIARWACWVADAPDRISVSTSSSASARRPTENMLATTAVAVRSRVLPVGSSARAASPAVTAWSGYEALASARQRADSSSAGREPLGGNRSSARP
ncbi:MAG TPA: hypothetical protein VH352_24860 [Pseudonocardiaceae bacterium]|nr:hypothetical protein [Pseudonocardiaceae bacterium]